MIKNSFQIFLLQLIVVFAYYSPDDVKYYVNLIESEIERSESFVLPTDAQSSRPYSNKHFEYGTFDHIVVGAGSAGAIVANRLSEDPLRKVLLLEAGGHENNFTEIPGMSGKALSLEHNWNYLTEPQTSSCLGMRERRCAYPRGKIIGGSSGINGLIYTRGNKKDFDLWCKQGNPGWCYNDVLPFFKKSENSKINGDLLYHGFGGYLNVEHIKPMNKFDTAFIEANIELNQTFLDYNGKRQKGVGITQYCQRNGRRGSTGRAFLQPILHRKNLVIQTYSHVTRILINPETKSAFGVLFAKDNKYYVARSRKDIVVSAGTIGSAQLLMLSGIGPKDHLETLGISVIHDLSVGDNFQDHVGFNNLHFVTNFSECKKDLDDNVRDYLDGIGDLTDGYGAKSIAFLQSNLSDTNDFPDIEILQLRFESTMKLFQTLFNFDENTYKRGWTNFDNNKSFTLLVLLLHPESRGYIRLKSNDPFEYPVINSQLLSDPDSKDIDTLYNGIQIALQLLETKPFKKLDAQLHPVHLPACKHFNYLSKVYWYCHIRQLATAVAHPIGTCKMGPNPLQGDVVDHNLKVYGIKNLRVADASIMPTEPSAHTNAAAMMIGEKAAHMILFE